MLITDQVESFLRSEGMIPGAGRVVVGISGGPDSLCLLDVLHRLGVMLLVAHLDHRLRSGSWSQAEFVLGQARDRGLPCVVERIRPPSLERRGLSLEEAARAARYRFLAESALAWGADRIATGHTADDQVETVLMHFLRGAGVEGLRGMQPKSDLGSRAGFPQASDLILIRPLLNTTRAQTEAHCAAAGLRPRRDRSNSDPRFFRNRLRHELLPLLETYNAGLRGAILRTARVMGRQEELVDRIAELAEAKTVRLGDNEIEFDRRGFLLLDPAIQACLLRRAAGRLSPDLRDFGFDAVELARTRMAETGRGRRTQLPGGLELADRGDKLVLLRLGEELVERTFPQLETDDAQYLHVPGALHLAHGGRLTAELSSPPASPDDPSPGEAWLGADRIRGRLQVRSPVPGDRMQPLGMTGRRKLGDIFNSLRVPVEARRRWPVVVDDEGPVWLAGLRLAQRVRLTTGTRRALRLFWEPGRDEPK